MSAPFPSADWLEALHEKLNGDARYGEIARHWEGDLRFEIQPGGNLKSTVGMYLDLWHGKCRAVEYNATSPRADARFTLRAEYGNFTEILLGKLDPMTAMLTNRLKVDGSLGYMMRNVPTVLDFVRCAREITSQVL
jgi:putative sterol carrier protein